MSSTTNMGTKAFALAAAVVAAAGASVLAHNDGPAALTSKDIAMAHQPRPAASSHVAGPHPAAAFSAMNSFLADQEVTTDPCHEFDHSDLNAIAELLLQMKDPKLNSIYTSRGDKRSFSSIEEHREQWAKEERQVRDMPDTHGKHTTNYKTTRDGKCAEIIMWWIHHLSEGTQQRLSSDLSFRLPLMPTDHNEEGDDAYNKRLSCTACHISVDAGDLPPINPSTDEEAAETAHGVKPVNPDDKGFCEIVDETGLPSVWYESEADLGNRRKRCDSDYDPPCRPCEGAGGYIWGDQQDQFDPVPCRVVGTPEQVPERERVNPIWPEGFTTEVRYTLINSFESGGLFPGGGPCAPHLLKNQTVTMWYDGTSDPNGPTMRRSARGFLDNQESWTRNDFNFYIKLEDLFCICITPTDGETGYPIGPLRHTWAVGSTFVGREEITLEFQNGRTVVADHWMKGPHHHWMDIETREMVRGWQPWQGLNLYFDWDNNKPDPERFVVDRSCYEGDLFQNISCISGAPADPVGFERTQAISEF